MRHYTSPDLPALAPPTAMPLSFGLLLLVAIGTAQAGLYKHVGPDGEVFYSDRIPQEAETQPIQGTISVYGAPQATSASHVTKSAAQTPRVVLYATTWCGVCKEAKAYMDRNGIRYTEYDVEKSATGKRDFEAMNGRAVPLLVVGEQHMYGFDADRLEALLATR